MTVDPSNPYIPPPTIDSALGTQEMAAVQEQLLDLVHGLRFTRFGIDQPQIVVVGDQSAGKSSVLEAITGTPFPRGPGACTRFATEIRLRRDKELSLAVFIVPDKDRPFRDQGRLKEYGGTVDNSVPVETLIRQATDFIAPKNIPGRFATNDILVIEKRGPDIPFLTLVDLPGLVRNASQDQSSDDIRTIEALSDRYIKSKRTIILAVVGGNSDYVHTPILIKARQFDPTGARSIGVLTKPDLAESIGLEDKFIELVQNRDKQNHFRLGWFVLLNPGPREPGQDWPTPFERQQREKKFFATHSKWSALPPEMCGSTALKRKLSVQLQHHVGYHSKSLRQQIPPPSRSPKFTGIDLNAASEWKVSSQADAGDDKSTDCLHRHGLLPTVGFLVCLLASIPSALLTGPALGRLLWGCTGGPVGDVLHLLEGMLLKPWFQMSAGFLVCPTSTAWTQISAAALQIYALSTMVLYQSINHDRSRSRIIFVAVLADLFVGTLITKEESNEIAIATMAILSPVILTLALGVGYFCQKNWEK